MSSPPPDPTPYQTLEGCPSDVYVSAPSARAAAPEEADADTLFAGRYRRGVPLGGGGGGTVWAGTDTLTGEDIVLKRIPALTPAELAAVRREVAALRWLRLPGVVQLRDEGVVGAAYYLVMDRVVGAPFLGVSAAGPVPWDAIREPVLDLLEILAGVHVAGVLHLDLKPDNVLHRPGERPVLLDFGLATGFALAAGRAVPRGATVRYAAPEQLTLQACDARTDLYAVGVMLYEALSGRQPHGAGTWGELAARRAEQGAPALASVAPEVPPEVARVVDTLLAPRPEDRPASAHDALVALGGRALFEPEGLPEGDAPNAESLRSLFAGPDLFLHLREDAAEVLWARTGGVRARVAEELGAWLRAGLARREGTLLRVDRSAIERLRSGLWVGGAAETDELGRAGDGDERTLRRLLAARAPGSEIVAAARALAADLVREGRLAQAIGAVDVGLAFARADGDAEAELLLLEDRAEAALGLEVPGVLDRTLAEVQRAGAAPAGLRTLLEATLVAWNGQPERALDLLEPLPPFAREGLELRRQAARVTAARWVSLDTGEALLADLKAWADAGSTERRAALVGWLGNLRYQQGRFDEAAALHLEKAETSSLPQVRMPARYNAAYALLDALRLLEAERIAEQLRTEAAARRHANLEARAMIVIRGVAYRMHRATAPRRDCVEAAGALSMPWVEASLAFIEAAVAWRMGDLVVGAQLGRIATDGFTRAGVEPARLLARGLVLVCSPDDPPSQDSIDTLAAEAVRCPVPGLGLQTLGLLRRAAGKWNHALNEAAAILAQTRPREQWGVRLEVLSFDEALNGN